MKGSAIPVVVAGPTGAVRARIAAAFATGGFRVIGSVRARELPKLAVRSRPDVAVVYVGGEPEVEAAVGEIMTTEPCPVLLVAPRGSGDAAMRALAAGALEVITWPETAVGEVPFRRALARSARLVAGLALVTRRRRAGTPAHHASLRRTPDGARLLAVGASTGGPQALIQILRGLKGHSACPIAIVQHMAPGFMNDFATWLRQASGHPVEIVFERQTLQAGIVYLAPGDQHLEVLAGGVARIRSGPPVHSCRPSADVLFESVAASYGAAAVGVLLTGMGEDGARGLLAMRQAGALTIAQDEQSSIVYGMPGSAASLGAAVRVLPLGEIPRAVIQALARPPERCA
jgi:two-component system chemotaxis response regulator CheB